MKKQKVQAKINLEALAGGAFAEKLNEALNKSGKNRTSKRSIRRARKWKESKKQSHISQGWP